LDLLCLGAVGLWTRLVWPMLLRELCEASVFKGIWWMPRHQEAKKDVALCDKLRGGESNL
jgi:hypothetical protein